MEEAIVVNMRRRGPRQLLGMGDAATAGAGIVDVLTGGEYTRVTDQLDRLELALKISIAASVLSGAVAILAILKDRR